MAIAMSQDAGSQMNAWSSQLRLNLGAITPQSVKSGPLIQLKNEFGGVKLAPRPPSRLIRRPFEDA